jgi:hypothetical protein
MPGEIENRLRMLITGMKGGDVTFLSQLFDEVRDIRQRESASSLAEILQLAAELSTPEPVLLTTFSMRMAIWVHSQVGRLGRKWASDSDSLKRLLSRVHNTGIYIGLNTWVYALASLTFSGAGSCGEATAFFIKLAVQDEVLSNHCLLPVLVSLGHNASGVNIEHVFLLACNKEQFVELKNRLSDLTGTQGRTSYQTFKSCVSEIEGVQVVDPYLLIAGSETSDFSLNPTERYMMAEAGLLLFPTTSQKVAGVEEQKEQEAALTLLNRGRVSFFGPIGPESNCSQLLRLFCQAEEIAGNAKVNGALQATYRSLISNFFQCFKYDNDPCGLRFSVADNLRRKVQLAQELINDQDGLAILMAAGNAASAPSAALVPPRRELPGFKPGFLTAQAQKEMTLDQYLTAVEEGDDLPARLPLSLCEALSKHFDWKKLLNDSENLVAAPSAR